MEKNENRKWRKKTQKKTLIIFLLSSNKKTGAGKKQNKKTFIIFWLSSNKKLVLGEHKTTQKNTLVVC